MHNMSEIQNMSYHDMQSESTSMQNIQNMQNMLNMLNTSNMQNMRKTLIWYIK